MSERSSGMATRVPDLRRVAAPLYGIAVLMVVLPLLDLAANVWPLRPSDPAWRYGATGLFSGFVLTPALGIGMLIALSTLLGHRLVGRLVAVSNLLLGLVIVIGCGLFALDVIQLRGVIEPAGRTTFDIGALKAAVKLATLGPLLIWAGVSGFRGRLTRPAPIDPILIRSAGAA